MHAKRTANGGSLRILAAALMSSVAAWPSVVLADELDEVIVSATKRGDTDIQSIAGSVNAIGGAELSEKGIVDFEGFAGQVPGLQFQDLGPGDKEFIIRGVNGNGPSVVGAYFDEFVITASDQQDGGGKNAPIKLVDLQRIEVLNGPQGTLYGANSMAGNIKYISNKPDASAFGAFADADLSGTRHGGFNYNVSGGLNIPIIEGVLAARLVGWRTDADGWIDQPRLQTSPTTFDGNAEDINDEETNGGRAMLRWTPDERLTVDAMYLYQDLETGGSSRFTARGVPAWPNQPPEIASLPGNTGFTPLPGLPSLTPGRNFVNSDITRNGRDDTVEIFGGTAAYKFDFGTATVSASHFDHDIQFRFDSTPILLFFGVPAPAITEQPQSYETTMVEARFASDLDGPLNFVGGLYYQKDNNDFAVFVPTTDGKGNAVPIDVLNSNDFFGGGTIFFARDRFDEVEQKAVFGEVTYDLMDRVHLLAGFRVFDSDLQSIQSTLHAFGGALSPVAGTVIGQNINGNDIGLIKTGDTTTRPKFSVSIDLNEDVMIYGLYSEGYRVGGVNNANQPFAPGIPATFKSDELTNWEAGFKSRLLSNTMQINAALFLIDWNDIQVEPRDPAGNIPFTTNGGAAELNGVEWSVAWSPTDQLNFTFAGNYFFDHQLTTDQPTLPGASPFVIVGLAGDEIPNVPKLQFFASATYDATIMNRPAHFTADLTYRGESNTEFRAGNPFNIALDSYALLDLYARFDLTERVTVGLYAKNATDSLAVIDGIGTFQDPESIVAARPRTFGATISLKY